MTYPKISVIIPIYNVEDKIEKCAISLFNQTLDSIEYIFVNDGTIDKSMDLLNDVIERYPARQRNIRIVNHEQNKGLSAARLTGLTISNGTYIAHCDSDDWVEPNIYELMLQKALIENADIVCADIFIEEGANIAESKYENNISYVEKHEYLSKMSLGGKYSALWNKLIKRSLYFDNDVFPINNISMWEDMVVTFRLIYYSHRIVFVNKTLYHYVINKESICSTYSIKHIRQQLLCAQIIDTFFLEKGNEEYGKYNIAIQNLKFIAKSKLLINQSTRNIELWKKSFPESNKYIWRYKELSIFRRFVYWLAIIGLPKISAKIFDGDIFYYLLNVFRK